MRTPRVVRAACSVFVLTGMVSVTIAAQGQVVPPNPSTAKTYSPPRTLDGQPDLQGVWNYSIGTPLERPEALTGQPFLTDENLAAAEKQILERGNRDLRDRTGTDLDVNRDYNQFWDSKQTKLLTRRTSLIIDPPDGTLPPLTPEAQKRLAARVEAARHRGPADSWDDRNLRERCLLNQVAGPPMLPLLGKDALLGQTYHFQIVQGPDAVAVINEVFQEVRIIPLDGRPHLLPASRLWLGDSRGRFEGNTLVIDTTNFNDKKRFQAATATAPIEVDENLHLVERITRVDEDTLDYQFTVDNPTIWTKSWTANVPMGRTKGQIYSYECHEGNYALPHILSGARAQEKATAADIAKKGSR